MKKIKRITTAVLAIVLVFTLSLTAFAQSQTITYKAPGVNVVGTAVVSFENKGLKQTNTITITNNSKQNLYMLIDGKGQYLSANGSYTLKYNAYAGINTSTKIKFQALGNDLNWRKITITTSTRGTIKFTKGDSAVKYK